MAVNEDDEELELDVVGGGGDDGGGGGTAAAAEADDDVEDDGGDNTHQRILSKSALQGRRDLTAVISQIYSGN